MPFSPPFFRFKIGSSSSSSSAPYVRRVPFDPDGIFIPRSDLFWGGSFPNQIIFLCHRSNSRGIRHLNSFLSVKKRKMHAPSYIEGRNPLLVIGRRTGRVTDNPGISMRSFLRQVPSGRGLLLPVEIRKKSASMAFLPGPRFWEDIAKGFSYTSGRRTPTVS